MRCAVAGPVLVPVLWRVTVRRPAKAGREDLAAAGSVVAEEDLAVVADSAAAADSARWVIWTAVLVHEAARPHSWAAAWGLTGPDKAADAQPFFSRTGFAAVVLMARLELAGRVPAAGR